VYLPWRSRVRSAPVDGHGFECGGMPLSAEPTPDAKPWHLALLGPALSSGTHSGDRARGSPAFPSRRIAASGHWPEAAVGRIPVVLRRVEANVAYPSRGDGGLPAGIRARKSGTLKIPTALR